MFAFSTMLGWSYYGEKSIEYLYRYGRLHHSSRKSPRKLRPDLSTSCDHIDYI